VIEHLLLAISYIFKALFIDIYTASLTLLVPCMNKKYNPVNAKPHESNLNADGYTQKY